MTQTKQWHCSLCPRTSRRGGKPAKAKSPSPKKATPTKAKAKKAVASPAEQAASPVRKSKRGGRAKASPKKAATPGMSFDAFHNLIRFPLTQGDNVSIRDHPLTTYANFLAFWTPSPPCTHFGLNHKTKFTQPRFLRTLFGPLPPPPRCVRTLWMVP